MGTKFAEEWRSAAASVRAVEGKRSGRISPSYMDGPTLFQSRGSDPLFSAVLDQEHAPCQELLQEWSVKAWK